MLVGHQTCLICVLRLLHTACAAGSSILQQIGLYLARVTTLLIRDSASQAAPLATKISTAKLLLRVDQPSNWQSLADCDKGGRIGCAMATRGMPETQQTTSLQLNPSWVEWLMGWPIGWTDCEQSEMAKFQAWRRSHGEFCKESK
jgi:hypothetical protein